MELVKKKKGESRLSAAAFIISLISLAHLNIFLLTQESLNGFSFFYMLLPFISLILFIASFFQKGYSRTFGWWGVLIYAFIFVSIVVIFFSAFTIYPKP
ncbi:hypothetical protein KP77_10460 [Jeotgalibacillus alimentarius]|uniref:Uncharacterized protein n=2 Tax=Jeotgalibacillus TaxID=157226 RepID=A0A0C2SC74_9BACL|nr:MULTISPECIES: hypothetical protein [Jeotgalibacillus]KIL51534.1 hypothetical protein KP77_10460 [Jeotgalibacillus alimentarius]MBM7578719.1 hypothetical protein [Jeotgalibacillus terrae]